MSRRLEHLALLALFASSGCEVDPYCIDGCDEGGVGDAGMDASRDSGTAGDDAGIDAGTDAGPDGCLDVELCNGVDDDCDGMVDEGIDTMTDLEHCGACGIACAPAHAFGACVAGMCEIDMCDVEWIDIDMDPSNGCEYRCVPTAMDDLLCDLRDNDCDGTTDEDIDFDGDPENCGSCGRLCRFAHASGACSMGMCVLGVCDPDFYDLDGSSGNGCEYACALASPPDEVCNVVDDDCDGTVDEGDPGGGGSCGSSVGACSPGTETCTGGRIVCMGETPPTTELCNGLDDDCDGSTDEGDPEGGRLCGTGTGSCTQGREVCSGGSLMCTGGTGPVPEVCDGLDNDCDGAIDEGNPGGGGACGSAVGACVAGLEACRGGVIVCEGAAGPVTETCNGLDDDCDGSTDENNPGGGGTCGTDVGACVPGTQTCTGGALSCVGSIGASPETCNSIDDDCDGAVDEGNPDGGAACGSTTGACTAGAATCVGGAIVCIGGTGPSPETCNSIDDNCNGMVDEGNPDGGGSCGTDVGLCSFGTQSCVGGAILCIGGTGPSPEACNSLDDDCDSSVDEGNPGGGGSCGTTTGACTAGTESCVGGALTCLGGTGPSPETCNGIDDDCDGTADEGNPGGGASCGTGAGQCTFGSMTCSGGGLVCMGGTGPSPETCNSLDDDCDGLTDESNPGGGAACGSSVGACTTGTDTCVGGTITCVGGTGPAAEACNGIDDDCDGSTDEGNPGGGGSCGLDVGLCSFGTRSCLGGSLICTGGTTPVPEACNSLDDDCDGSIDEGNPDGGASCGSSTGACATGLQTCVGGALSCIGGTGPSTEACNGIDDDCDGSIDEMNPGGGGSCGTDVGLCTFGTRTCSGGGIICVGGTGPAPEACNALDDDCDSFIDEGNPGGGASCGSSVGACTAGTEACLGGTIQCSGGTGPTVEICDTIDNDCDGSTDEGFDLLNDPNNCGMCGNSCAALPNATSGCSAGSCVLISCDTGWVDLDGVASTGCEYMCSFAGAEICNGQDDDCDGSTDETLTPPSTFCNANGVCMGTSPTCGGASGWECNYPATFESTETLCDGLDNDCDGGVDEPFPLVGTSCNNGELGVCRLTGSYVCNGTMDGVLCNAPASGGGSPETCNSLDDDCDGVTDENAPDAWVSFTAGALGTRFIYAYEASRPDATDTDQGNSTTRSCSVADRLPWTSVTYPQAQAACAAAGGRLCTEVEWQEACESSTDNCDWSHATSCTTYQPLVCNGNDYDTDPVMPGDQDGTIPTGSLASCYSSWGGAGQRAFDMSGNVEEWTEARQAGVNPLRGGSNNDIMGGMRCDFDFVVAGDAISLPAVGFRCCRDTPAYCVNGIFDGDETDIDCGGSCNGCPDGDNCGAGGDCLSGVCSGGICAVPTCSDGVQNGGETDIDCGGATACARCPEFDTCIIDSDCAAGQCLGGICRTCSVFGTDSFGYRGCEDTPGGPPICPDIRGSGTPLGLSDDGSASVSLGFTFDFYGTGYSTARVNANGTLSFASGSSMTWSNSCFPYATVPTFIAPFWDDLDPGNPGGEVWYETVGTAPNRDFIVLWDTEHFSSTSSRVDLRLMLHESTNDITICYVDTDFANASYDTGVSATSGIQGDTATFLQYSCNTAVLTNGLTLQYFHP